MTFTYQQWIWVVSLIWVEFWCHTLKQKEMPLMQIWAGQLLLTSTATDELLGTLLLLLSQAVKDGLAWPLLGVSSAENEAWSRFKNRCENSDQTQYGFVENVEGEQKKSRMAQNFAVNEKLTIVVQSLWNLVKIFISWVL